MTLPFRPLLTPAPAAHILPAADVARLAPAAVDADQTTNPQDP